MHRWRGVPGVTPWPSGQCLLDRQRHDGRTRAGDRGGLELGLGQTTLERTELAGCIALALSVPATAVLVNHLTWRPGAYPLPYGTRLSGPSLAVGYEVRSETGRIRCLDLRLLTLRIQPAAPPLPS